MAGEVNVSKISPDKNIAMLSGFIKGLNARKKELEEQRIAKAEAILKREEQISKERYQNRLATVAEERNRIQEESNISDEQVKRLEASQKLQFHIDDITQKVLDREWEKKKVGLQQANALELQQLIQSGQSALKNIELYNQMILNGQMPTKDLQDIIARDVNNVRDNATRIQVAEMQTGTQLQVAGANIESKEKIAQLPSRGAIKPIDLVSEYNALYDSYNSLAKNISDKNQSTMLRQQVMDMGADLLRKYNQMTPEQKSRVVRPSLYAAHTTGKVKGKTELFGTEAEYAMYGWTMFNKNTQQLITSGVSAYENGESLNSIKEALDKDTTHKTADKQMAYDEIEKYAKARGTVKKAK